MGSFPVFIDVDRGAPLVFGGGELALAKVRLLLKRARAVDVASERLVTAFAPFESDGRVRRISSDAGTQSIAGRPLVISATGDETADASVFEIARSLGVPVNVPDRPELSTFSLPAIVDRNPVTIAIGTEGAAPVLATRLRAELEQWLPRRLGPLAEIAREYRPAVADALPPGPERRRFWDDIFSGEAAAAILSGDEDRGRRTIETRLANLVGAAKQALGRVILVGAGPGDPDLLTVKAVRALKCADVVLHDGLMGDGVLELARREATLLSVAKAKGRHSRTQAEINALMVGYAREGKTVVRLKGGDPLVFGRGGEEIDALRASGIPVEIVPGITAATAAAASLQMPLTQRDVASSIIFLSGHAAGDGEADFGDVDFAGLARGRTTLAVYMGLSSSHILAARLLSSDWLPATPVLAISRISQAAERRVATTIEALASPGHLPLDGPTLLIVGEVASLDLNGVVERISDSAPAARKDFAHA